MLEEYLAGEGFEAQSVHDGQSALERARSGGFDLMVLDVMMPGMNGFDVLRNLRPDSQLPVIMLTARGGDMDSIIGLEIGADDYLAKPCNPGVLAARLRAILRRGGVGINNDNSDSSAIEVGDLRLLPLAHRVEVAGKGIGLTGSEFAMLELLMQNPGQVVHRDRLAEAGLGRRLLPYDRSVDVHISNLRRKLGNSRSGRSRIHTRRGHGYQLLIDDE
jgi:DNA-binding response OmpR family regulator